LSSTLLRELLADEESKLQALQVLAMLPWLDQDVMALMHTLHNDSSLVVQQAADKVLQRLPSYM
jgi:hypothetical protein